MNLPSNPYVLPALTVALVAASLAVFIWRRRPASGATPSAVAMLALAVWCLGYTFELAGADLPSKIFWSKFEYLGILSAPLAWLAFALEYTGRERLLSRRNLALLAIPPLLTLALVLTNESHGLIWSHVELDTRLSFPMFNPIHGIGFWIHSVYAYLLLLASTLLIIQALVRSASLYRKQAAALLIATLGPWIGNALYISGLSPFPQLDLTPFAFTLSGAALAWGLFRYRLLDIVPVARDKVVENLREGVIVLDAHDRIVDFNPAAQTIFGHKAVDVIGKSAAVVFSAYGDLVQQYRDVPETRAEITRGTGEAQHWFDLRIYPLFSYHPGVLSGRIVVIQDITERKRAEEALRQLNDELERRVENRTTELTRVNAELVNEIAEHKQAETALRKSEVKNRALLNAIPDLMFRMNRHGEVLDYRPSRASARAVPPGEMIGHTASDLMTEIPTMPGEAVQHTLSYMKQAFQTGQMQVYESKVPVNGGVREFETRMVISGEDEVLCISRDITERKRRERELEAIAAMSAALRVAESRAEMFPVILDQLLDLLQMKGATLAMRDPVSGEIVIEMGRGSWSNFTSVRLPPGEGVSGRVIATGERYVTTDFKNDPQLARPDLVGDLSYAACVPLSVQGQTIGALWVGRESAIGEEQVRLLTSIADMAANAIHRATLHEQTELHLKRLTALSTIDRAISASVDLKLTLGVLLDQTVTQLSVDAALVLLLKPATQTLEFAAGTGLRTGVFKNASLHVGDDYAGRAALERRTIVIKDCHSEVPGAPRLKSLISRLQSEGVITLIAVPLIAAGVVKGVLEVLHRTPLAPDAEWLDFLQSLAGQAAIAIDNAGLFDGLQRANVELVRSYDDTIEGWSRALDLRDKETEGHTLRVTEVTLSGSCDAST